MDRLTRIKLSGFRSIRDLGEGLELGAINVLIGANGSGKSNLLTFFRLLNWLTRDSLSDWVLRNGGAADNLYYGPGLTERVHTTLDYSGVSGDGRFSLTLIHRRPDSLVVAAETVDGPDQRSTVQVDAGGDTSLVLARTVKRVDLDGASALGIVALLGSTGVYHFNETSGAARVMKQCDLRNGSLLWTDGGNLAPVLHQIRESQEPHYDRIVDVVQQVVPFFGDFELRPIHPNADRLPFAWRERGSDIIFGPHQLSDGSLRFIMLATLLLAPPEMRPKVILLDEPELGLHPTAIESLAAMVYTATSDERPSQVILTTQSVTLLEHFEPADVVVVDRVRDDQAHGPGEVPYRSVFRRLDADALAAWLEDYSLGELWVKNVLGGKPSA